MVKTVAVNKEDLLNYAAQNRAARDAGVAEDSLQEWLAQTGRGEGVPLLKGLNLRGADLSYAGLAGVKIEGSTFEGATLDQADLSGATMRKSCLIGASAKGATFAGADMQGCNFSGAKLLGAGPLAKRDTRKITDFTATRLEGATFDNAQLRNVLFNAAHLTDARFCGAELENTRFNHANMVGADMTDSRPNFRVPVGTRAYPVGVEFTGAVLIGAKGLEVYEGKLDAAIQSPQQLENAVLRMAAMGEGLQVLPDYIQQQMQTRREAAGTVLERGTQEQGLQEALMRLNAVAPAAGGFAQKERSRSQMGQVREM